MKDKEPNPKRQDIRESGYVIKQFFLTAKEVDALRDDPTDQNIRITREED